VGTELGGRLVSRVRVEGSDDDLCACVRRSLRDGEADSHRSAGHNGHLPSELHGGS